MVEYTDDNNLLFSSSVFSLDIDFLEYSSPFNELLTQSNNNYSTISEIEEQKQSTLKPNQLQAMHISPMFKTTKVFKKIQPRKLKGSIALKPNTIKYKTGRWKKEECLLFVKGLLLYGIQWQKINHLIPTRSVEQIRSHAQKFFGILRKTIPYSDNITTVNAGIRNHFVRVLNEVIQPRNGFYDIIRAAIYKNEHVSVLGKVNYFLIKKDNKAVNKTR